MKKIWASVFLLFIAFQANAKDPMTKTFLVLFQSQELKQHKTDLNLIEEQFSSFDTRSYEGNSELALFIEIPACDFDECFLGDFLIEISDRKTIKLEQIAFRLFDLTENENIFENYLSFVKEAPVGKKKDPKINLGL